MLTFRGMIKFYASLLGSAPAILTMYTQIDKHNCQGRNRGVYSSWQSKNPTIQNPCVETFILMRSQNSVRKARKGKNKGKAKIF